MNSTLQFVVTLAALVLAAAAPVGTMIAVGFRLGDRIDKLVERISSVEVEIGRHDERLKAGFATIEDRLDRLEGEFRDHASATSRLAHGRGSQ